MYTSVVLALVGLYAPTLDQEPVWNANYWQARKQGQQQGKPLAVFVGSGQAGFEKLSREGRLSPAVRRTLQASYVCVYLDTNTREGGSLAETFAINNGVGVVLSDRTGQTQAFHHDGELAETDLVHNLQRFADPDVVVQETITNHRVSYYPPSGSIRLSTIPSGRSC
jgi:hypothetical protein